MFALFEHTQQSVYPVYNCSSAFHPVAAIHRDAATSSLSQARDPIINVDISPLTELKESDCSATSKQRQRRLRESAADQYVCREPSCLEL